MSVNTIFNLLYISSPSFGYLNRSCICRIARAQKATERKEAEIHFRRSRCLASHCKNQKLLPAFIVINASPTTGPHYRYTRGSWFRLALPVEYVQDGVHGTVWCWPKLLVQSDNSLRLSWCPVYVAILHRDSPTFRCLANWHVFTKHIARLWLSRNTPSHIVSWKTVPFKQKEIRSNTCIGRTLQPLCLRLTFGVWPNAHVLGEILPAFSTNSQLLQHL